MKKIAILFFLLLSLNYVYASECQYTELKFYTEIVSQFHIGNSNTVFGPDLIISDFGKTGDGKDSFRIYNTLPTDITVQVEYIQILTGGGGKYEKYGNNRIVNISMNDYATLETQYAFSDSFWNYQTRIENETLKYAILEPDFLILKKDVVTKNVTVCKQCMGILCFNDGDVCQKNSECGGGYCVEGRCSNSESCYENNCMCEEKGKIQCNSNKCIDKAVVPLDVKPSCGLDAQCQSGYINPDSELCAKSPSQLEKEKQEKALVDQTAVDKRNKEIMIGVIILSIVIVIGIGVALYLRNKHEKERQKTEYAKQKTLQMKTELVMKQLHAKNEELENIKKEIAELTKSRKMREEEIVKLKKLRKTKDEVLNEIANNNKLREKEFEKHRQHELDKLNKLKNDKESVLNEIGQIEATIDSKWENLKPFPDSQAKNRLVIINPYLGGYKCFYNKELELKEYPSSSLVHRWVWKHNNGNWPRRGYHIHHIDGDKYNNVIENLKEIDGDEHYEMHRRN